MKQIMIMIIKKSTIIKKFFKIKINKLIQNPMTLKFKILFNKIKY